ncbi:uncharacterized protein LOC117611922 isoform X1 [Osmia lignaria lignaria]|uniref:uncharacterized protein LOC117611922 isoform X1 n=1 Tax=Osmia lignaria lignaria TaxID=1437193 RepID=UPI00402BD904
MVVPTIWIRNNMLFSGEQYQERQLTDAELKVQRSLEKLSVPDWYLNKRSTSPKIVNVDPIELRPPSWKCPLPKNSSINSTSSDLSDTPTKASKNNNEKSTSNNSSDQPKPPESKQRKSSSKSPHTKEEIFDTWVPEVNLPVDISKTFPKVSPSRKIHNINIVFPPGPKVDIFDNQDCKTISNNYSNCNTIRVQEQSADFSRKNEESPCRKKNNVQEVVETPVKTPTTRGSYRFRTTSTPKFTPANLFSSTVIEDSPKPKKNLSKNILEKSSIFEKSFGSNDHSDFSIDHCRKPKKLSQDLLEKTFVFDRSFQSIEDLSTNISRDSCIFEKNIRSIEPIFFEKDDGALSTLKSSSMVRDMVRKLEVSKNSSQTPQKTSTFTWNKQAPIQIRKSTFQLKTPSMFQEKRFNLASRNPREEKPCLETQSPCTRFLNSNRKSTELENVVRSKHLTREKGVVQGLIGVLAEKVNQSTLPRQKQVAEVNRNFVKKVVSALENADRSKNEQVPKTRMISANEDTGSGSDSEFKSYTTSVSLKDTDSSDSDQRTPSPKSDEDNRFDYSYMTTTSIHQDDDSVYWIPVSRCKLPRTSSLISIMSRLSGNGHSPCVSPIRSEHEEQQTWGVTYRRTSSLSKKLFRIDETVVIDSGYSDKSDRSGISSRYEDSNWSEDNQYDSGSECKYTKVKRSRRKSIVNNFHF